jgi:hypothetical protein
VNRDCGRGQISFFVAVDVERPVQLLVAPAGQEFVMKIHCRETMTRHVNHQCDQHENPFDCPDNLIGYPVIMDRSGECRIIIHDGGKVLFQD